MNVITESKLTYTMVTAAQVSTILEQLRVDQFYVVVCKPMVERQVDSMFVIVAEKCRKESFP